MRLEIKKNTINKGSAAEAPHSKSMAHRLLICAGMADGISTVRGVDISTDILATIDCLRSLGADIKEVTESGQERENIGIARNLTLMVSGTAPGSAKGTVMQCRESGSTLRFITPLSALSGQEITLTGTSTLLSRPMSVYEDLFKEKGLTMHRTEDAMLVSGSLPAGTYTVPGNVSSQFISGLLFALPLLNGDSRIVIKGRAESRPYIDMTIEALSQFGVWTGWEQDGHILTVPGGQTYKAHDAEVEGDWSGASFLYALGAEVTGLDHNSSQGDKVCLEYFRKLDEGPAELDIADCPDLGPVLAAYAALRHGCTLTGTGRLKYKESDRAAVLREELAKFGVGSDIQENSMIIGNGAEAPAEILCGHDDHRVVMALAVMCAETGGVIDGAEAVTKSFPDFFDRMRELGAVIYEVN